MGGGCLRGVAPTLLSLLQVPLPDLSVYPWWVLGPPHPLPLAPPQILLWAPVVAPPGSPPRTPWGPVLPRVTPHLPPQGSPHTSWGHPVSSRTSQIPSWGSFIFPAASPNSSQGPPDPSCVPHPSRFTPNPPPVSPHSSQGCVPLTSPKSSPSPLSFLELLKSFSWAPQILSWGPPSLLGSPQILLPPPSSVPNPSSGSLPWHWGPSKK